MSVSLIIMAAGMGSRYGGLKQIDAFGPHGETILEYSLYDAIRAGFDHVVLVIRESFHEDFKKTLGDRFADKIRVSYVYQEVNPDIPGFDDLPERTKPRGTGHAVLSAKDVIDGPFCVINADDYYGVDAYKQMYTWLTQSCTSDACSMVGYVLENTLSAHGTVNRGICHTNKQGHLVSIQEHLKIAKTNDTSAQDEQGTVFPLDSVVSMNFWGFDYSMFSVFEDEFTAFLQSSRHIEKSEFFITVPPNRFVHEAGKHCDVMISHDSWYGVTYADDKEFVQRAIAIRIQEGIYPEHLRV